jgi:hypothetical protein
LFETIIPVLNENPNVLLLIVGISKESEIAKLYAHPQILFLGVIPTSELEACEWASDIYIEPFPCSSFTALLEVGMKKKVIHLMHEPSEITKVLPDIAAFEYTNSKENWRNNLNKLIHDTVFREQLLEQQYEYFKREYNITEWGEKLAKIYKIGIEKNHKILLKNQDVFFMNEDINFLYTIHPNNNTIPIPYWRTLPWRWRIQFLRFSFCEKTKKLIYRKRDIILMLSPIKPNAFVNACKQIKFILRKSKNITLIFK